jgi:uncharacterized protein involved in exopolysaccharide biosynthesis
MEKQLGFQDIKHFIKRRKKSFFITFFLIFVTGIVVAIALPPLYLSKATILIEEQEIPENYVQSGISSYAEERVEMISQRVLSRDRLLEIINEFNLFPDQKNNYTKSELLAKMRKRIVLETINAEIQHKKTGRPVATTVAFEVSYEDKNPVAAQKVAEKLSSLYLEEEIKSREKRSSDTTTFFEQELAKLQKEIHDYEIKISQFKKAHIGELPEFNNVNLQTIGRLESDLNRLTIRLRSLEEKKIGLEGQIANVEPLTPIVIEGDNMAMNPKERLKRLYLELISMRSTVSEKHPDVKRLKREIAELESQIGKTDTAVIKIKKLNHMMGQFAEAKGSLGPNHPDVIKLSNQIETLSNEVEVLTTEQAMTSLSNQQPDNPVYISLLTQIAVTENEIKSILEEKNNILKEIEKYRRRIENGPVVEKEYSALTHGYDNAKRKYDDLQDKYREAKVTQEMEISDRGERFTMKSPAFFPEKPYKPNRLAIILIGCLVALGAGLGISAAREGIDNSITTADQIKEITGVPVLSSISFIVTDHEKNLNRLKKLGWIFILVIFVGIGLYCIEQYVINLNELWTIILDRLKIIA